MQGLVVMKVTFTISKRDFQHLISIRMKSSQSSIVKRYGLIVLFIVLVSLIFWLESKSVFSVVIFDVLTLIILRFAWGRYLIRRYRNSNLHQPRTVELTPTSMLTYIDGVQTAVAWSQIKRIQETSRLLIFEIKNSGVVVVPNDAFKTREERVQFVESAKRTIVNA